MRIAELCNDASVHKNSVTVAIELFAGCSVHEALCPMRR